MRDFEVVDLNLRHSMQCYARASEQGEIRNHPGVVLACSGINSPVFNFAMLTEPVGSELAELDRRIMIAKVYFAARALRWSLWVCTDWLDAGTLAAAYRVIERRGLRRSAKCPGMLADSIAPPARDFPPLEYRRVSDPDTRLAYCHLVSAVFRLPFDTTLMVYNSERAWETDMIAYVGYLDRQPVTTAASVTVGGAVGIYGVATLPDCRGRGMAEATMRYALSQAREMSGIERSVLQSTDQAHPLYQRMGYRPVTQYGVYAHD